MQISLSLFLPIAFIVKKNGKSALHVSPKKLVESPVPALESGTYHTPSDALHQLKFTGDLQPWPDFLNVVHTTHQSHTWHNEVLDLTLQTRDPYTYGNVEVGNEHGVRGWFYQYFGDVLDTIFTSQSKRIRFADLRCVQSTHTGTPDVILKDGNHVLKVVGELQVPWVCEHLLEDELYDVNELRNILAQQIKYMQMLGCVYGFLSNYEETIFLK